MMRQVSFSSSLLLCPRFCTIAILPSFLSRLVDTLIKGTATNLPSYTFTDIGDILFELMLYDRPPVCLWLEATLKALPETNASGIAAVTKKQLVSFHADVTKAEEPDAVVDAVRQFSRLWR